MLEWFELDFHPVGSAGRSGDAISGRATVEQHWQSFVIDGGTTEAGAAMCDHIEKYYETNLINHVVLTHADDDHSSGLREVLNRFRVENLWIKRPWLFADQLVHAFKGNWTATGLAKRLRECFPIVAELEDLAISKGITIQPPFQGSVIGPFLVLSPSVNFYLELLPQMTRTPDAVNVDKRRGTQPTNFLAEMLGIVGRVAESWGIETLKEGGETSASNESSIVLYGAIDGKPILTCGDAGQQALTKAADLAEAIGLPLRDFFLAQIPHHGSRRNVGPTILNRLFGDKMIVPYKRFNAIASAAKNDEHHPRKVVLNAFKRRGGYWATTENGVVQFRHNLERREGWSDIPEGPFFDEVEEYT